VLNAQQQLFTTQRDLSRARSVLLNGLKLKQGNGSLQEDDLSEVNRYLTATANAAAVPSARALPPTLPARPLAEPRPARARRPAQHDADLRMRR
jgi:hypothetical protein